MKTPVAGYVVSAKRSAGGRRGVLAVLVTLTTAAQVGLLWSLLRQGGMNGLEWTLVVLQVLLVPWISIGFWTAIIGFRVNWRRCDHPLKAAPSLASPSGARLRAPPRTAIVIPVYNENPTRVFAGVGAMYQELVEHGHHRQFDFFVLSDTVDPEIWIEEEIRWHELCRELKAAGRLFYRNRPRNAGRKSGNIRDFCRRWGAYYRYMVVLDADSIMSATTLTELVRRMERNRRVGLIQVPPMLANRQSLFARIQQFAFSLYGRLYHAGFDFWQLGESNYWGHNAIVRLKPFIKHCGLPALPGDRPLGGEILSHDLIEAALLRRAGWEVWLAPDLGGSYEEVPPTLLDYAGRDRRWCQGNLQHMGLILARGFRPMSRLHLLTGAMSYLAAPLWLLFLVLAGVRGFCPSGLEPLSVPPEARVTLDAPEFMALLGLTLGVLLLPKLLSLVLLLKESGWSRAYGGFPRAGLSVVLETVFSVLTGPIFVLLRTKFVLAFLLRRDFGWPEQIREDHRTSLREAMRAHAGHTFVGATACLAVYWWAPQVLWLLVPALLGLLLSIPLSIGSSSVGAGRRARKLGLFMVPEEVELPSVLAKVRENQEALGGRRESAGPASTWVSRAIVDPLVNALHVALRASPEPEVEARGAGQDLLGQALENGVDSLSREEQRMLLLDGPAALRLHILAWSLSPGTSPVDGVSGDLPPGSWAGQRHENPRQAPISAI